MFAQSLRDAARRFGPRPLLIDAAGQPWTYSDVDRLSDEVAAGMAAVGVREREVVALTLPSVPEYVVAYAAAAKVGAATAGVNPRLSDAERHALLDLVDPALVVSTADQVDALRSPGTTPPPLAPDPDRPVVIVFTSGTTGTPKGAVFDERRLEAICAIDVGLGVHEGGGPMLASTEFCHIGFATKLAWYVRVGATQVLMERWRADDALRLVAEHRLVALGGISAQFALLLRSPAFDEADLSSLERVTLGGGLASPALRAEIMERFRSQLSVRFSLTESGGCGTGTAYDAPEEEALYTVGRPRGPIEVAIRDGDGREVARGDAGEVCLRTPTAMVGYRGDEAATAAAFHADGFLRTGDLGFLDGDGCLRLVGRAKEMYIRGGYNVYPAEVEGVLARHPGVADVAVVPRADDVMGEVGVAVVVPTDPTRPPTLDDLRAFGADSLASYKLPEDVRVVDALPLTSMHKLDRAKLLRSLPVLDGEFRPGDEIHRQEPGPEDRSR
ncbi:MAG: long-chain fatty acid--CoA ligase [Actinobacteria bacterium]|nr:long-chain fatty acid--CoA ligase [Actinomycetota bacterium]